MRKITSNKKGLSPIITTVLLIALVVVIIAVIFLWFRGMVGEGITKFGENVNLVCRKINFDADYSSDTLNIVNNGNVPIYEFNLKIGNGGTYSTTNIREVTCDGDCWPKTGLNMGGSYSKRMSSFIPESATELELVPILFGSANSGKKRFICEGDYGKKLEI